MQIEEDNNLVIKDRAFLFNIVNTAHPFYVSKQVEKQRLKRLENTG